jgi:hypothetical protein
MRRETVARKMMEALGLAVPEEKPKNDQPVAVKEDEIDRVREANALLYFFQAPELFYAKTCPHCGVGFLVSRRFVKCCSYTCIAKELEKIGIRWSTLKGEEGYDYEIDRVFIDRVYEGNEPLWIRNVDLIRSLCQELEPKVDA